MIKFTTPSFVSMRGVDYLSAEYRWVKSHDVVDIMFNRVSRYDRNLGWALIFNNIETQVKFKKEFDL